MNLSKQIQHYRKARSYSQEALAKKLYVSRQTVSNWETGHSYPDLENLLLLSTLFDVSLDELVKGDVLMMKNAVARAQMWRWGYVLSGAILLLPIGLAAIAVFRGNVWLYAIYGIILVALSIASWRSEVLKRRNHVQTFAEVLAFMNNESHHDAPIKRHSDRMNKVLVVCGIVGYYVVMLFANTWFFHLFK
ncbi:helix-turn-helix transcriptional regulator [Lacticaseibacillus sp. GG6-2]